MSRQRLMADAVICGGTNRMKKTAVIKGKCRACGICVRSCPKKQIRLTRESAVIGADCVGCGECVRACPFDVIELQP